MAKDWINRHPKLVFILVGLLFAVLTNVGQYHITEDYTSTLEKRIEVSSVKIDSLVEENKQLKQSTKTFKIIRPDGTIEEKSETELESTSSISTQIKQEYEQKLTDLRNEVKLSTKTRKHLNISAGLSTDGDYIINTTYEVYRPFSLGIGGLFNKDPYKNEYWITLGISL